MLTAMYLGGAVDGESGVSIEAGHAGHVDDAACKREGGKVTQRSSAVSRNLSNSVRRMQSYFESRFTGRLRKLSASHGLGIVKINISSFYPSSVFVLHVHRRSI